MGGRANAIRLAVAAVAALLFAAPVAHAKPGDVIVGEDGASNTVVRIHENGNQSVLASGAPLDSPGGGDFGTDGRLYQSDYGFTGIIRINPQTHTAHGLSSSPLFGSVSDVEFAPDNHLYASDFELPTVFKISPKTGHTSILTTGGNLTSATYALTVAPSGDIFAADTGGRVVEVNPKTHQQTLVSDDPDLSGLIGIAVSVKGKIYGLTDEVLQIRRSQPVASNATVITNGNDLLDGPYDLAFSLSGKLLTANNGGDNVVKIDPRTGHESVAFSGGILQSPEGITVEPPRCGGKVATIYGTPNGDRIKASPSPDVIAGLGGKDVIRGLRGNDFICGDAGKDKLIGGTGHDRLIGGPGHDVTKP